MKYKKYENIELAAYILLLIVYVTFLILYASGVFK